MSIESFSEIHKSVAIGHRSSNDMTSLELQQILNLLHKQTGHNFSSYKSNSIQRRIDRQMYINHIHSYTEYVSFLQNHTSEINVLYHDLLIGVTSFFRDTEAFDELKNIITQRLLSLKSQEYVVRVWVPACSTGEEAYSIAMIFQECMESINQRYTIQIFGSDINTDSLDVARSGIYPEAISLDIHPNRLEKFFLKENNRYKIKDEIRRMVIFGKQNLLSDPAFTRLDLICCRNLLIYLDTASQMSLLTTFHNSLKSAGILFLGLSESITECADCFDVIGKKHKIFRRKDYFQPSINLSNSIISKYDDASSIYAQLYNTQYVPISNIASCNEELQSKNEMLESIKAELFSTKTSLKQLNDELICVNSELQNNIDQLACSDDDMNNLLDCMKAAVIFLDNNFCIRRFTPTTLKYINLSELTIGKSIFCILTDIKYKKLIESIKTVLTTQLPNSTSLQNNDGQDYYAHSHPYRTLANMIDGLIIILNDIPMEMENKEKIQVSIVSF